MAAGLIAGHSPPQIAMKRDRVQERLQAVVRAAHLGRERLGLVVGEASAARRPARASSSCSRRPRTAGRGRRTTRSILPVRKPRTVGRSAGSSSRLAYRGHRIACPADGSEHRGDRLQREPAGGLVAAGEGQLELELVEPVGASDVTQPHPVDQRPERRFDRRAQPMRRPDRAHRGRGPARARAARDLRRRARRRGPGAVKSVASSTRMDERAELDPDRRCPERRFAAQLRPRHAGDRGRRRRGSGSSLRTGRSGSLDTSGSWASAVMSV